jgi:hypothetical protein
MAELDFYVDVNLNGNALLAGSATLNGKPALTTDSTFSVVQGLECSVNSGNTQYLDIAAGKATILDNLGVRHTVSPTAFTLRLTATWVAGNNQGKLASGSLAASTWYFVYLMRKRVDGTLDYIISASNSLTTYTDGSSNVWDLSMIMQILTTSGSAIDDFVQQGNEITWKIPKLIYNANAATTSALITTNTPSGLITKAKLGIVAGTLASNAVLSLWVRDPATTDSAASNVNRDAFSAGGTRSISSAEPFTNVSSQVRIRADAVSDSQTTLIYDKGFHCARGVASTVVNGTTRGFVNQLALFSPLNVDYPATAYPQISSRNAIPILNFDAATTESGVWGFPPLRNYGGGSLSITLKSSMASATTGNVVITAAIEAETNSDSITADSFATAVSSGAVAVPGTNGLYFDVTITLSNSQIDGLTNGDFWRLKITRDATNSSDTATGDYQFIRGEIREV